MKRIVRQSHLVGVSFIVLSIVLSACGGSNQQVTNPTPTPSLPNIPYSAITIGLPQEVIKNEKLVGPLPDSTLMNISLYFKLTSSQQQKLQQAVKSGPSKSIGLDPKIIQGIETFFGVSQVKLNVDNEQTYGSFSAPAKTVAKLFQTSFLQFTYKNQQFYAPDPNKPPKLPSLVVSNLTAVQGLDSYQQPMNTGVMFQKSEGKQSHQDCSPTQGVVPPQIRNSYGFSTFYQHGFTGQKMTIVLAEIDGFNQSDVANYAACVNFNLNNLQVVNVDAPPTKAEGESTLDIEMLMSLAPNATIIDYQTGSNTQGLLDEMTQISQLKSGPGTVVSVSIGGPEQQTSKAFLDALNQRLQVIDSHQESIFFASGDCAGYTDQVFGSKSVSFPASSPFAISVGGTELQTDAQGNRLNEVTWSDPNPDQGNCQNAWGSGGGTSNYFPQPKYQPSSGPNIGELSNSLGFRNLPDVSAIATDIAIYNKGEWEVVGGTSAATPIWAAGMALVNQALLAKKGLFYYGPGLLYYAGQFQGPFFDIVQGTNFAYDAGPGWDYTTGFGSPNLVSLFNVLFAAKTSK